MGAKYHRIFEIERYFQNPNTMHNFALLGRHIKWSEIADPEGPRTQQKHYRNCRSSSLNRSQTSQLSSGLIAFEVRCTTTEIHAQVDNAQRASISEKNKMCPELHSSSIWSEFLSLIVML